MYREVRLACNRWEDEVLPNNLKEDTKHREGVEEEVLKVGQDRIEDNKVRVNKDKVPREVDLYPKPLDLLDNCNQIFKEFSTLM